MRRLVWLLLGILASWSIAPPVLAHHRVELIAELPGDYAAYGIATGRDGLIYVSDVGGLREGHILVYSPSGRLQDRISIPAGSSRVASLRGLAFDSNGNLYVADVGDESSERGRIIKINTRGRQSVFASGLTLPIGLAFDEQDILYVTDSRHGAVLWIGPDGASATFIEDDRLRRRSRYGSGVTGLAFAPGGRALYLTNPSADTLLKVAIDRDGSAGRLSELVDGRELRDDKDIEGVLERPEGIAVDNRGNVHVASSRSNRVDVFSSEGRLLGRVPAGTRSSFSSPTSLATDGRSVYVANLASEFGPSHISRFRFDDQD